MKKINKKIILTIFVCTQSLLLFGAEARRSDAVLKDIPGFEGRKNKNGQLEISISEHLATGHLVKRHSIELSPASTFEDCFQKIAETLSVSPDKLMLGAGEGRVITSDGFVQGLPALGVIGKRKQLVSSKYEALKQLVCMPNAWGKIIKYADVQN